MSDLNPNQNDPTDRFKKIVADWKEADQLMPVGNIDEQDRVNHALLHHLTEARQDSNLLQPRLDPSSKPFVGKALTYIKTLISMLMRPVVKPFLLKQLPVNDVVFELGFKSVAMEKRLFRLEQELRTARADIASLRQQLGQRSHHDDDGLHS